MPQLSPGPFTARINEPPSNVILDDRAVWEILDSNIPRAQLAKRWSHDFSGQANIRHRRPHRGRAAVKDEDAEAETDKYHSFKTSNSAKVPPYYFFGEKDFTPIFYQELPRAAEESEPIDDTPEKPKQHNQYTAPELLVRNGAQSASLTKGKYRPRVNTFLRRSPSPPWVKDRSRLFGGIGIGRGPVTAPVTPGGFDFSFASATAPIGAAAAKESMWVEQNDEPEQEEPEENEDGEFSSIFDVTLSGGASGSGVDSSTPMAQAAMRKRRASPSRFFNRTKRPRQMGYIERLAAGISEQDAIAEANAGFEETTQQANVENNNEDVNQLRSELEAANNAIIEKDDEIALLKAQVESMQAQMAPVAEDD